MKRNMFAAINSVFPPDHVLLKYPSDRPDFRPTPLVRKHRLSAVDATRLSLILNHWCLLTENHNGFSSVLRKALHKCTDSFGADPRKTFRCGRIHTCPFCRITEGMRIIKEIHEAAPGGIRMARGDISDVPALFTWPSEACLYSIRSLQLDTRTGSLEPRVAFFTKGKGQIPYNIRALRFVVREVIYWDYAVTRYHTTDYLAVMERRGLITRPKPKSKPLKAALSDVS